MRESVPSYDELYSISDLHLGGSEREGQIFCRGERVRKLCDHLKKKEGRLAFVIAGDLFDSLPYLTGTGSYIAVDGAAALIREIIEHPSFSPVFAGLKSFLEGTSHELILLIGNHNLEIALPEAQEALLNEIAPTPETRGRVRFSTSGCGFRCQIGRIDEEKGPAEATPAADRRCPATVFVTHGNEADPWNHVDHEALRRAAHARALGHAFDVRGWEPNAGTRLVIDAMNKVRQENPFIDLLKPETDAALKVLRVVAPRTLLGFIDALSALTQAAVAHAGPHVVLTADGRVIQQPEAESIRLLSEAARAALQWDDDDSESALLARVAKLDDGKVRPSSLVSDEEAKLRLGLGLTYEFARVFKGKTPAQALQTALESWIKEDRSFNLLDRDSTCKGILGQVGDGVDIVITGHTHLPRWIVATERNIVYLNAGAWCRTIGVRDWYFEKENTFAPLNAALRAGSLKVLDDTRLQDEEGKVWPLVLDATLAAHVKSDREAVRAELVRFTEENGEVKATVVDPEISALEWS